jgi:hypothetical protein
VEGRLVRIDAPRHASRPASQARLPAGDPRPRVGPLARILLLVAIAFLARVPLAGAEFFQNEPPAAGDGAAQDPLIEDLRGSNEKSTLAAQALLLAVHQNRDAKAPRYQAFLDLILTREHLVAFPQDFEVAEKLLAAMGYLSTQGTGFPSSGDRVLPLLAIGPENFRRAVRGALLNFIQAETASGTLAASATYRALVSRLQAQEGAPPAAGSLSEICLILREIDPKELVGLLVENLVRTSRREKPGAREAEWMDLYILELRRFLLLDFSTVEGWENWWRENRSRSFVSLSSAALKSFHQKRVQLWERTFQRLKDSGSPDRYLGALQDAFELDVSADMRQAVLQAAGAFPAWLKDLRPMADAPSAVVLDDAARDQALGRGATFILRILEGKDYRPVSSETRRTAMSALQKYNGFISRSPVLLDRVVAWVLEELRSAPPPAGAAVAGSRLDANGDAPRQHLLELLRTIGTLRLADDVIRQFLVETITPRQPAWQPDIEILSEAVTALGKLQEKRPDRASIRLILDLHAYATEPLEKEWRPLRRACVMALHVAPVDPEDREAVRRLYEGTLAQADEGQQRIPAIIGLGILARGGDRQAVESLRAVLENRARYDSSEVSAVIDALAYLGGETALSCLLDALASKEKPFQDQVWGKVTSLLKGGGRELLAWLMERLERRAFEEDLRTYSEILVRLAQEPELKDLLAEDKLKLDDPASLDSFWRCLWIEVRAHEALGKEDSALARLSQWTDFVRRNDRVQEQRPGASRELEQLRSRLQEEAALTVSLLQEPPREAADLARHFTRILVLADEEPSNRWRLLHWMLNELQALKASPRNQSLLQELQTQLSQAPLKQIVESLPATLQERFQKEFSSARDRLRAPADATSGG